jgi:hypothetical protein
VSNHRIEREVGKPDSRRLGVKESAILQCCALATDGGSRRFQDVSFNYGPKGVEKVLTKLEGRGWIAGRTVVTARITVEGERAPKEHLDARRTPD